MEAPRLSLRKFISVGPIKQMRSSIAGPRPSDLASTANVKCVLACLFDKAISNAHGDEGRNK